ncbi:Uncharacterised protein [Vibrio cholerae]|nr:Uncharacterised protein [Vibrio cholerae]
MSPEATARRITSLIIRHSLLTVSRVPCAFTGSRILSTVLGLMS